MFNSIMKSVFGSANDRYVKSLGKIVDRINALEPQMQALSDAELAAQTDKFRALLAEGKTLDDILPEAFATVREASVRVLGMRHFDVQMVGGIVLHRGEIAEMRTGEGKTLVATLATYLNAIEGKGVHVVTVNDYLAARDSEWMGRLHKFLGLTVGVIVPNISEQQRRDAYNSDITYSTNNELGFDYLRDNMKHERGQMVQRPFNFAIVDEVDSILIDEARTPLIISGPTEDKSDLYLSIDEVVKTFPEDWYEKDEKQRNIQLTEDGTEQLEKLLIERGLLETENLYDVENTQVVHHVDQALRAVHMFKRDTDYIVKDDKVVIIDEFTGRMMEGRRWSNGLHQAVEAKEGVTIEKETQTLATITIQNYFRLYTKLAGMTGTAATEAQEFFDIYKLGVLSIPTHEPCIRDDANDSVYKTRREKYNAVLDEIKDIHRQGRPILVGTISVEVSELISRMLKKNGVIHSVLNAKYHEQEAEIVTRAGQKGAVTIATNMAGRGTDIKLGQGVETIGGLHVMGTERHESRRIDRQLRGRCARQGDAGSTRFFLSLEDDLLRLFASNNRLFKFVEKGIAEGEAIGNSGLLDRSIQTAQKNVEKHHFQIRKRTLEYDDVMNKQREEIYGFRNDVMHSEQVQDKLIGIMDEVIANKVQEFCDPELDPVNWDFQSLSDWANLTFPVGVSADLLAGLVEGKAAAGTDNERDMTPHQRLLFDDISAKAKEAYQLKISFEDSDALVAVERYTILNSIDRLWQEHLYEMDSLRYSIGLRAYGQRDPILEYKAEGYHMFQELQVNIWTEICQNIFRSASSVDAFQSFLRNLPVQEVHQSSSAFGAEERRAANEASDMVDEASDMVSRAEPVRTAVKVGRNDPCPCGSGKKHKKCCG